MRRRFLLWLLLGIIWSGGGDGQTAWGDNVTLCYHRFNDSLEEMYSVLPEVFAWQIQYIQSQNIPLIKLKDLEAAYGSSQTALSDSVLVTVDDGWQDVQNVVPFCRKNQVPLTLYLYPLVLNHGLYLRDAELEALKNNPLIDFGCHSYTHPVLRRLSAPLLTHEVLDSQTWLERRLGRRLDTFAYPFGMYDTATRNLVAAHYKLAFGVNDGGNRRKTSTANLNRFVVYRTTSFGEFMDMAGHVHEPFSQGRYTSIKLGDGSEGRNFVYTKAQVYRFPPEGLQRAVLIIPSMQLGAAWMYKAVAAFNQQGIHAYALVTRNNNIPFYRPDKQIMQDIGVWGLPDYVQDLKTTLDYVRGREKKFAVVTWGDGFDWLATAVAGDSRCAEGIAGILAVNPSLDNPQNLPEYYARERERMDALLSQGQFGLENLSFYIKMKTLSDLMIVKPDAQSPFAKRLGYVDTFTNRQVFHEELDRLDHPELSIDETDEEYSLETFKGAFMQPLPVFSMVVPIRVMLDYHDLWARNFTDLAGSTLTPSNLDLPVAVWASGFYRRNPDRILRMFPKLRLQAKYYRDEDSTVEILLSDSTIGQMVEQIGSFFQPEPQPQLPVQVPVPVPPETPKKFWGFF
ncbi:MAG: polysaccharide deacetylase family protein [Candidatus Firestonebacteria bacterium]|nr:polysaccharide deacetylase family protein [Candidatus Firestonebacteria bacterium]